MLNALARSVHSNDNFNDYGDLKHQDEIAGKVNALQGLLRAQNGDEHSWGALHMLASANPNMSQDPRTSSQLVAQLMVDQARANDRAQHMSQYAQDSGGNLQRAGIAFGSTNPTTKYNQERDDLANLVLNNRNYFKALASGAGGMSQAEIAQHLQKSGFNPNLARYFNAGGA
jgi:hypothetical protein